MGYNFDDLALNKDFLITIIVPSNLIKSFPAEVQELQMKIDMELQSFNSKVRLFAKGEKIANVSGVIKK